MSTVIKVENISKQYRLGQVGTGSLAHDINRGWQRLLGKEDPYLKVGETNDRSTKGGSDYVWALKDINFDVQQGEILGIIGRNGAGKSTLLKILSRTTTPTTGSIKIRGKIASLLEVGTGFHPELSGRDNIFLNGAILGMSRKSIQLKLEEIIDFSGVERYIDTPVKRYSSGMYVRLAFAVAAHLEPDILIVDEVLAVGDMEFQKKCVGKMKEVSINEGRTVLFVSHSMEAVKKLCNTGILMENGQIVKQSNIEEIYTTYVKSHIRDFIAGKELYNHPLNDFVKIKKFILSKSIINSFENLEFELHLTSSFKNTFNGIALLFYNISDERTAIVDLRCKEMIENTSINNDIFIKGTINALPFLDGDYFIGLAIGSDLCSDNFFNLLFLTVNKSMIKDNITNYPNSSLGHMLLKSEFTIKFI